MNRPNLTRHDPWSTGLSEQRVSELVLRGTTVLPRHCGTIFLWYQYRHLYGTFYYRNTTSTTVLRHGTCPLLTHSNEHLLDRIVFRLKLQLSACLLSFTAKLHTFYLFILCFVVNQISEMTSVSSQHVSSLHVTLAQRYTNCFYLFTYLH